MNNLNQLDWSTIRSFVAVADTGSLTAAAKKTGQSQPTVGRHIKAVEAALGTELFIREVGGLQLTDKGLSLLEPAREMQAAAARLATIAAGQDSSLTGTVRITASVVVSHYLLPPIIADIRRQNPHIEIELLASDSSENLIFREADIAVRMYRPTQMDIVTRHIADQPIALYATPALLEQSEQHSSIEGLSSLPFVGFDQSEMIIQAMNQAGFEVDKHFFGVRCDDQSAYWQLVRAGCGVGAMQTAIGDAEPRVVRLEPQPELPSLPMWLAAPRALHQNERIKCVWDMLLQGLSNR